jgi:hypothetical protein
MSEHEDIWHVQLESGEVRQLTLDQLDAFFNNGIIDEDTYVLADGEMEWRTLRVVLGLEEESAAPAPVVPAAVFAPAKPFAPTLQVTPTPAPVSYGAVPAYPRESAAPGELHSPSIRPVVSEIDPGELDFDDAMFKKSSKAKWIVSGGVVAAVAAMAIGVGASRMGSFHSSDVSATVVNAVPTTPAPPPEVVTPPPPPADPQPVVQPKLTDDAKKSLAAKDNAFAQKMDARKAARSAKGSAPAKKGSQPFSKGGNAYDPLNAKL